LRQKELEFWIVVILGFDYAII